MSEGKLTKIGALWLKEKNGKKYMSGKIDRPLPAGSTILVYKNTFKQEDKHPDYTLNTFLEEDEAYQPPADDDDRDGFF